MGFDLVFCDKDNNFEEIKCEFNEGRFSGNYEFSRLILLGFGISCEETEYDEEFYRPDKNSFNILKEKVRKLEVNSDFWLRALQYLEENENVYLYNNF